VSITCRCSYSCWWCRWFWQRINKFVADRLWGIYRVVFAIFILFYRLVIWLYSRSYTYVRQVRCYGTITINSILLEWYIFYNVCTHTEMWEDRIMLLQSMYAMLFGVALARSVSLYCHWVNAGGVALMFRVLQHAS